MKKFKKLRIAMYEHDIKQIDLAEILGKHPNHVNALLQGRAVWRLDEMQATLDIIGQTDLNEFFGREAI